MGNLQPKIAATQQQGYYGYPSYATNLAPANSFQAYTYGASAAPTQLYGYTNPIYGFPTAATKAPSFSYTAPAPPTSSSPSTAGLSRPISGLSAAVTTSFPSATATTVPFLRPTASAGGAQPVGFSTTATAGPAPSSVSFSYGTPANATAGYAGVGTAVAGAAALPTAASYSYRPGGYSGPAPGAWGAPNGFAATGTTPVSGPAATAGAGQSVAATPPSAASYSYGAPIPGSSTPHTSTYPTSWGTSLGSGTPVGVGALPSAASYSSGSRLYGGGSAPTSSYPASLGVSVGSGAGAGVGAAVTPPNAAPFSYGAPSYGGSSPPTSA